MTDPLPASPGGVAQQANDFNWDDHSLEPGIAIALSGGGFRAMLFHAGALMRLNELGVLSRVARISSVSGGSISSGFLAWVWRQLGAPDAGGAFAQFQQKYVEPILAFSREKIDVGDILTGMLPWTSAAEQVAASYDRALFKNATDWCPVPVFQALRRGLRHGAARQAEFAAVHGRYCVLGVSAVPLSARPYPTRGQLYRLARTTAHWQRPCAVPDTGLALGRRRLR
jgi:hypothetical protein